MYFYLQYVNLQFQWVVELRLGNLKGSILVKEISYIVCLFIILGISEPRSPPSCIEYVFFIINILNILILPLKKIFVY